MAIRTVSKAIAAAQEIAVNDSVPAERKEQLVKQVLDAGAAATAQPVWDKLHATAEATCGERIVMCCGLGMTETSPSALFVADLEVQAGQIGIPTPGMEIKLVPNGDKIGQVQNRQSGIDLTFSMPKSASILALVSGDQRILTAHWNAVRETMSWVEGKFAEAAVARIVSLNNRAVMLTSSP